MSEWSIDDEIEEELTDDELDDELDDEIIRVRKKKPAKDGRKKRKKKKKGAFLKILPVIIAVLLIIVVGGAFYGQKLMEKYSYGTERADLNEYFHTEAGKLSVVMNFEKIEEKAVMIDGKPYFSLEFVKQYFTDHFYVNEEEKAVLYTTHDQTIKCMIGEDFKYYLTADRQVDLDYAPVIDGGDSVYFAVDYLKLFTFIKYEVYSNPDYIVVCTEDLPGYTAAVVNKDTAIRYQGGIKSPILEDLPSGTRIGVVEVLEDWAKVCSVHGMIGYVEVKQFDELEEPFPGYLVEEPEIPLQYQPISYNGKINMAFHQVFADPASHFSGDTAEVKSVNIMAPTLFRIKDSDGTIEALPAEKYVAAAKEKGMDVWAVWTDVDYEVDMKQVLKSSTRRRAIIDRMIEESTSAGISGINIDFERISSEGADDFIQFLRELSVETHKNGIILSVDNYALASVTGFYNRKEQGNVVDYVVIMGYDEHWASSPTPGSVASIDYVERGIRETLKEVPAEKVINAVPFYTRIWRTNDEGKVGSDTIGMQMQKEWIEQVGMTTAWDNETCQNYGEMEVGGKNCQIWLEDAESLEVKLNVMDSYNIAGVAEWKLGFETPDIWDVFEKYMAGTLNPEAVKPAEPEEAGTDATATDAVATDAAAEQGAEQ